MSGSIFLILHLHGHDSTWEVSYLSVLTRLSGQQVWRQRGVESVCEEHKLELDLQGNKQRYAWSESHIITLICGYNGA